MLQTCAKILCLLLIIILSNNLYAQDRKDQFSNPILAGFYPDPSICRVGSDYYLINSSFSYFPGIPIFHSKDLVNWTQIGHIMDRPSQLNTDSLGISRGIFAPAIRFHDGLFYVTCTLIDKGGNFVVTAANPAGPWSDPVWIPQVNGIDPSLFFDTDGRAYIIYNSNPPDDKPLYNGHRTLRMYEFDWKNLKVTGNESILVNGGVDISKKPVWIEGPHILKKDEYYYLIAAEGGTGFDHSEVVFRSKHVNGPYVPYEKNPILTQRTLDRSRKHPITSTGHADIVDTESGQWWAVFLGTRPYPPYEQDYYNTGRETFLAPVEWQNGWPIINPGHDEVQYYYTVPLKSSVKKSSRRYSGNFTFTDNFDNDKLGFSWELLRTPREKWFDLTARRGYLTVNVRPETCSEKTNPSFIGYRQQHLKGSATTALDFSPRNENEKAGLLVFQNEDHFYFLCKSTKDGEAIVQLYKSTNDATKPMEAIASQKITDPTQELQLKIEAHEGTYSFLYAPPSGKWITLKDNVDGTFLSTKVAGGFVGCLYAIYATSLGKPSTNTAYFDWFTYQGDDDVYKKN